MIASKEKEVREIHFPSHAVPGLILGVKTCDVFLCSLAIVVLLFIEIDYQPQGQ